MLRNYSLIEKPNKLLASYSIVYGLKSSYDEPLDV